MGWRGNYVRPGGWRGEGFQQRTLTCLGMKFEFWLATAPGLGDTL